MIFVSLLGLLLLNAMKNILHFVLRFDLFQKLLKVINLFMNQLLCYLLRNAPEPGSTDFDTSEFQFLLDDP